MVKRILWWVGFLSLVGLFVYSPQPGRAPLWLTRLRGKPLWQGPRSWRGCTPPISESESVTEGTLSRSSCSPG
jgi:hypothetical protein